MCKPNFYKFPRKIASTLSLSGRSLLEAYFEPRGSSSDPKSALTLVREPTLWSYLLQIVAALRVAHAASAACRCIGLSRVLLTSGGRVRLGSTGVLDALEAPQTRRPHADGIDVLSAFFLIKVGTSFLSQI